MIMVSIIGDSISTFDGFNPDGYEIFYDEINKARNELYDVIDTWWAKTLKHFGWDLCVNNSYSGSKVSGDNFPAAVSHERLLRLHSDTNNPDLLLVYIGFNDFGYGVDKTVFADAYRNMIFQINDLYPTTRVICGTLMRSKIKNHNDWIFPESFAGISLEEYNHTIRKICHDTNVYIADLSAKEQRYETIDGTHPTFKGHATIANAWIDCLEQLKLDFVK